MFSGRRWHRHDPWKAWGELPDWRLEWTDDLPPEIFGLTLYSERRVLLANGMTQAERRSTAEHERHHALRGPAPFGRELREELLVDAIAGRMLMPSIKRVCHALAFHHAVIQSAAEELWVDEDLLHSRLSSLCGWEREYMNEQMTTILL